MEVGAADRLQLEEVKHVVVLPTGCRGMRTQ